MDVKVDNDWTVDDLIEYEKENVLKVNHEYQRGLRWSTSQKQLFIDSIFRGYSIPAFYFHKTKAPKSGNRYFEIVDGQQRINAITSFCDDGFGLLIPNEEKGGFKFPNFVKDSECPWGGKRFSELTDDFKNRLKSHKIVVYEISTDNPNSIRDLFIRLQGGTPLTPQDKRDSWPGKFTAFVLRIGGKDKVSKWYGLKLFLEIAKVSNESRRRKLVAQLFMLYWSISNENKFCDIHSSNLDEFYHSQVGFDEESSEVKRFEKVSKELYRLFQGQPKLVGHYLIHLFLFVNQLRDEYAPGWEAKLVSAWQVFEERRKKAAENVKNDIEDEMNRYYHRYGYMTQAKSDLASSIRQRHVFFVEEMMSLLSPKRLDERRSFSELERQTIFFRDNGQCQWCRQKGSSHPVAYDECEVHHIVPYSHGGATNVSNGALVHRNCHPKKSQDIKDFEDWWRRRSERNFEQVGSKRSRQRHGAKIPPDDTKLKFVYQNQEFEGIVRDKKYIINYNGQRKVCDSLSAASRVITNTSRNGWNDWQFRLPGKNNYILADHWRQNQP